MNRFFAFLVLVVSLGGVVVWQLMFTDSVNFYLVSAAVLVLSMLPFFARFEIKNITAREVTLIATLIALAVVSRAAFYLVPQVKPIAAVVIVSAICLGAERGYIVGAFSMFVSNFLFGQGFWTPFQMVAMGLVGFIAGLIFKVIKANRYTVSVVGFVLVFAVYGIIVDTSTVLMSLGDNLSLSGALAIYGAGVPFSLVFAGSTAIFLFLFADSFVKKIDRINTKFGLALS